MTVHFVYRSHYEGPMGLHHKVFDDESVLAWFQRHWEPIEGDASWAHAEEVLGTRVYGFNTMFRNIAEHSVPRPKTNSQLTEFLEEHLYVEGEILHSPHCVQVITDDDEIQLAYYFFDDAYLKRHGPLAALLLRDDWQLPTMAGEGTFQPQVKTQALRPKAKGEGTTYLVFHSYYDSENLDELLGPCRIDGVRLPDLARHLIAARPVEDQWPLELLLLRSQILPEARRGKPKEPEAAFLHALVDSPTDGASWMIFNDWLLEQGRPPVGTTLLDQGLRRSAQYPLTALEQFFSSDIKLVQEQLKDQFAVNRNALKRRAEKALVQTAEHVAQAYLHTDRWDDRDLYHQWFLFDDLWASAHPALAQSILRYADRWDVLTPGDD
jgi:uncharacterized protein (TIGR02996 family)